MTEILEAYGAVKLSESFKQEVETARRNFDQLLQKFISRKRVYERTLCFNLDLAAIEASIRCNRDECTHSYLLDWDSVIFCYDCGEELNIPSASSSGVRVPKPEYARRLMEEEEKIKNTTMNEIPDGLEECDRVKYIGERSAPAAGRGSSRSLRAADCLSDDIYRL